MKFPFSIPGIRVLPVWTVFSVKTVKTDVLNPSATVVFLQLFRSVLSLKGPVQKSRLSGLAKSEHSLKLEQLADL